jgi:hypothetical protein
MMPQAVDAIRRKSAWPGAALGALALILLAPGCQATEIRAGDYSFSDELGGFRLLSAKGTGTASDPVVVEEELQDVAAVTLVVRRIQSVAAGPRRELYAPLSLVKAVTNKSVRVWAGFEIELQEILKRPSVYSDGLSFSQYAAQQADVSSDSFAENEREFEPYDRIRFTSGHVDPGATARFKVTITDPTPVSPFYIVQEPKLLSAGLDSGPSFAFDLFRQNRLAAAAP